MKPTEESLESQIQKSATRLKAASGYLITMAEPMHVLQRMKWEVMILRAEITALRDMMVARGQLDTAEYQRRSMDYMDKYTAIIETDIGIRVGPDAKIIELTTRAENNKFGGKKVN